TLQEVGVNQTVSKGYQTEKAEKTNTYTTKEVKIRTSSIVITSYIKAQHDLIGWMILGEKQKSSEQRFVGSSTNGKKRRDIG
ncbi:17857_t:CDS:2, partial [Acaulospora morrowiae]